MVYRYHVTQEGVPKRLWMQGQNLFSGAHFDHWCVRVPLSSLLSSSPPPLARCATCWPGPTCRRVVTYTDYSPGRPDPTLFKTPELCKDKLAMTPPAVSGPRGGGGALRASRLRMEAVLPRVRYSGDAEVSPSAAAARVDVLCGGGRSSVPSAWEWDGRPIIYS